uniref:Uncharacterized protein n=1 Tax=Arundo donax TaxID=35708 RepID=A0A0A8Y004_ARUDO
MCSFHRQIRSATMGKHAGMFCAQLAIHATENMLRLTMDDTIEHPFLLYV